MVSKYYDGYHNFGLELEKFEISHRGYYISFEKYIELK